MSYQLSVDAVVEIGSTVRRGAQTGTVAKIWRDDDGQILEVSLVPTVILASELPEWTVLWAPGDEFGDDQYQWMRATLR
jgi:hypothetical protein